MNNEYDLIALDMDDTLLRSDKTISEKTLASFKKVREAGKYVVICTGRPVSEIGPYDKQFTDLQYYICESGALVYDHFAKKVTARHTIDASATEDIIDVIKDRDVMVQVMVNGASIVEGAKVPNMTHYCMGVYVPLYTAVATHVDDIIPVIRENSGQIEKINIYHTSREESIRTSEALAARNLPIERIYAETASLELSPKGIHKGVGISDLARFLNIPIEKTIAVGDADNDIPMLKAAGLALAVGNANDHAKAAADLIIPSANDDGCLYAINKYILGE
ncbi:MAG: HAD family hydrolase [Lachnospiraceae bacterium]|uniref:HAD family hydrolase n=1 Tax=Candidatus Weimeria bifida TaxID=2599074 RepID=A0A6N7IX18_9FIRM|nr:HAD family hydrolase [Candidatus Weimeria bifida]RRF97270.1 MAG: HAD family hydrolase [Lachnospiraceae bacterium]